jgi:hypothetical protein
MFEHGICDTFYVQLYMSVIKTTLLPILLFKLVSQACYNVSFCRSNWKLMSMMKID